MYSMVLFDLFQEREHFLFLDTSYWKDRQRAIDVFHRSTEEVLNCVLHLLIESGIEKYQFPLKNRISRGMPSSEKSQIQVFVHSRYSIAMFFQMVYKSLESLLH